MPSPFRLRTRLDAAILASVLAMASMNALVLVRQLAVTGLAGTLA
ncbi:MAG TPA: hypothetical protein PKD92_07515 [Novosphingobium sp.]|nr:hypothetical protein [Novosphingobium sp.]HMP56404.1 hypothetical protein [Novosphingobium sp.]